MASCEKHGVASPPRGARSGGHDSCQAASTAATCTSSTGGARCHGAALSASKFRRGAARQSAAKSIAGFLLDFSSVAVETKAESEPATSLSGNLYMVWVKYGLLTLGRPSVHCYSTLRAWSLLCGSTLRVSQAARQRWLLAVAGLFFSVF